MPKKQLVLVEAIVPGGDTDAHPEHPIYIPVEPPPGIWGPNDPQPTPPIYIPIVPPSDAHPDHTLPGDLPHPDQGLPQPEQPVDPGYGVPEGGHVPDMGAHPEHPIFIPVQPPDGFWGPDDPRPTPPIYIPVEPPSGGDAHPEHPIVLPPSLSDEQKEAIRAFLYGNLPPYESVQPV